MNREKIFWSIIIIFCVVIVGIPIFTGTLFHGDTLFQLNRIEGVKEGILSGQFPVWIHAYQLNGYGVPLGIFYPDLFFYFPAFLRIMGLPLNEVYQAFCITIFLAMAFLGWYGFYLISVVATYKHPVRLGAVTSASYISFWYVIFDLYQRADLGEALSLVFYPLALASVLSVLYGNEEKWPLAVIAIFCIIHSHIISSIFLLIVILLICCYSWRQVVQKKRLVAISKAIVFSIVLNASFYIPFLYGYFTMDFKHPFIITNEMLNQIAGGDSWDRWTVKFFLGLQLLWGAPVTINLILFAKQWIMAILKKEHHIPNIAKWMFGMTLFLMFASTTAFPWQFIQSLPGMGWLVLIQFPWRLMELATIGAAFCGSIGFLTMIQHSERVNRIAAISCIVTCLVNMLLFTTAFVYKVNMNHISEADLKVGNLLSHDFDGSNDYIFAGKTFEEMQNKNGKLLSTSDIYTSASIMDWNRRGTTISFTYSSDVPTTIQLPLFAYEGYEAKDSEGNLLGITTNENHVMVVQLPQGSETIQVSYAGLPLFKYAEAVSVFGLLLLIGIIMKENGRGFKRKSRQSSSPSMGTEQDR